MSGRLLAIEIGGSKLQMFVGDGSGTILHRQRFPVNPAQGGAAIRRQIEGALGNLLAAWDPGAIGAGFGGPVDRLTGSICCSHQVEGWADFPLGEWLGQQSGLPVVVENDSNTAALGEAVCGGGRGFDPVFYFNLGSGVGGGLVAEGRIYHGAKPGEAEFGHLRADRTGATIESRCSGWAVDQKIRLMAESAPESPLARLVGGRKGGEARHLAAALAQGDAAALRIIEETSADLGFALSHVVHLFHPAVIVMGGGLSLVGEPLRLAVETNLHRLVMEAFQPGPPVRLAELGEDAVPVGALLLARQRLNRR
jgi:glucokinase